MTTTPMPVQEITIELDVPVPMRDGTVLRADVSRPAVKGRYPTLLCRSPYDKGILFEGLLDFKQAVRAGYVVVIQDTRGRFTSDGEWLPWKYEREDGYDTVEWVAAQPYSNGKVGTFGGSYLGSTQWSSAISGAPHLSAIAPQVTWSEPADGLLFRGGAIELGLNTFWGLLTALSQHPKAGLSPEDMMAKLVSNMVAMSSMKDATYWQLPAGAQAAIVETGQPDLGVARALADPTTMDESRCRHRSTYADIRIGRRGRLHPVRARGSLIVTSNKNFAPWGEVFGDDTIAAAMIDRLVHHVEVIALKGDSYRLKNRELGRVPTAATEEN